MWYYISYGVRYIKWDLPVTKEMYNYIDDHDGVSNHQSHGCLLNLSFTSRLMKKAPCHRLLCGEITGTGEFPAQRTSYAENVSIWWRHHVMQVSSEPPYLNSSRWGKMTTIVPATLWMHFRQWHFFVYLLKISIKSAHKIQLRISEYLSIIWTNDELVY